MSDTLSDARNRVRDLRTQARDRDCRGFWPDVVEWLCDQLEAEWKAQEPPAPATSAPTSTDDSMRNSCDHCHTYHDGACDPFKLGFVAGKTWAASDPARRADVLALYADTRQPQTEPWTDEQKQALVGVADAMLSAVAPDWRTYTCHRCGYVTTIQAEQHGPQMCDRTNCGGSRYPAPRDGEQET
jgi:hypothetical protein